MVKDLFARYYKLLDKCILGLQISDVVFEKKKRKISLSAVWFNDSYG